MNIILLAFGEIHISDMEVVTYIKTLQHGNIINSRIIKRKSIKLLKAASYLKIGDYIFLKRRRENDILS